MIVIKNGNCIISIWEGAYLTDLTITNFRKILKMAANKWQNDPEEIRAQLLQTLEYERIKCEKDLERTDAFYSSRERNRTISRLKKIEKMKSEVQKYV